LPLLSDEQTVCADKKFFCPIQNLAIFTNSREKECTTSTDDNIKMKKKQAESYFLEQVKQPGLFFCLGSPEEWREAEPFIQKVRKEFPELKVLVYHTHGKPEPKPAAPYLLVADKRDFSLLGKEKKPLKQWLSKHRFDLLLVFAKNGDKRCRRLVTGINARLKAGNSLPGEEPWTDITLGKPGTALSYEDFYIELKIYFKQLNIKLLS
jgi:hypothetical protein